MPSNPHTPPSALTSPPPSRSGPRWRALLEARWQDRLQEVTELSLAYHTAAGSAPTSGGQERRLLRRVVSARRKLADTEEALSRLSAGCYGHCEQCGSPIPTGLLAMIPETRYCPRCDGGG